MNHDLILNYVSALNGDCSAIQFLSILTLILQHTEYNYKYNVSCKVALQKSHLAYCLP
jgi:hypothetical protein